MTGRRDSSRPVYFPRTASAGPWQRSTTLHPDIVYNHIVTARQKAAAFFIILGVVLCGAAATLNVTWIVSYWSSGWKMALGVTFFALIIGGLITYTVFLVREIRKNE